MKLKRNFIYKILRLLSVFFVFVLSITSIACQQFGQNSHFTGIGSNSVSPLAMGQNSFMTNNPVGNYIYQNTGSGDGYKSQMKKDGFASDFGMTSSRKNPITYAKDNNQKLIELRKLWKSKKLRTLTYAFDAIGISVHLPDKMTLEKGSHIPIIDLNELAKLYSKDKKLVQSVTWASLIKNESDQFKKQWNVNIPVAIGIKGGKNTSGKAETFVNVINLKLNNKAKNPTQKQVTKNQRFSFTDNFNDIYLENQKIKGSIAYYSFGQIKSIKLSKIKLANITELSTKLTEVPTITMIRNNEYKWSRPFNIIYSVENNKSVAFANYLLSPKAQSLVLKKNFIPLNLEQINIQLPSWIPDLDYYNQQNQLVKGMNNKKNVNYGL